MPIFFDLSSLLPAIERNPFKPPLLRDEVPAAPIVSEKEIEAEPIVDTGLPIPSHYDFDMMRALVQDPFRLFVYWQLKDNPFDRLKRIFPASEIEHFHSVLKLIDETNNISVMVNAAYMREYWFQVFPDRTYRVELGMHSPRYGYIKQLTSQSVQMPRGGPSDKAAEEETYYIGADEYITVLRESHLVSDRAYTLEELLPELGGPGAPAGARNAIWDSLPASFRRLMAAIADLQAGRDFDRWWERLGREELGALVREFLDTVHHMGGGEMGYMLLLRYLPEILRRALEDDRPHEIRVDKPMSVYLAERLGIGGASEFSQPPEGEQDVPSDRNRPESAQWLPSMKG